MDKGGQEMGAFYNRSNDDHLRIRASRQGGDIVFHSRFDNVSTFPGTERIRIGHGLVNPGASSIQTRANGNEATRIMIHEDPTNRIRKGLSLLHLGFSAAGPTFAGGGYRAWMDVGTFTAVGSDNMYVGMKSESNLLQDWGNTQSAVISWGDDIGATNPSDRMRFIFTSGQNNNTIAGSVQGLEIARMVGTDNYGKMGIGDFFTSNADPINTLEVRSNIPNTTLNPLTSALPTRSGLRLTNLTAGSTIDAATNSSNTVLSVNNDGDVILVDGGGNGIGSCAAPTILAADGSIQLNGNSFYFEGQTQDDRVSIGVPCGTGLFSKFRVDNVITNTPNNLINTLYINSGSNTNTATFTYGLLSFANVSDGAHNVGGYFIASNPTNNSTSSIGINALAEGGIRNIGIAATAVPNPNITGGSINIAGSFNGDIQHTGVITQLSDVNIKEDIVGLENGLELLQQLEPTKFKYKTIPNLTLSGGDHFGFIAQELEAALPELVADATIPERLDEQGNVVAPSQTYKSVNYVELIPITVKAVKELDAIVSEATLSDAQLKQNVQPLQNSLDLVQQLNGVSFEWNQQVDTSLNLPSGTEIGFIAQDVAQVVPEVTYDDNKGYKHVEYQKVVPLLVEANKQLKDSLDQIKSDYQNLQQQLATLSQQVASIQTCMDNLPVGAGCGSNGTTQANSVMPTTNSTQAHELLSVTLTSDTENAVLYQNQPNPFANTTTIRYYLVEDASTAVMVFHDQYGREISSQVLTDTGYGQIEVNAENLASGIYTYSLMINGEVVATKKMIKAK